MMTMLLRKASKLPPKAKVKKVKVRAKVQGMARQLTGKVNKPLMAKASPWKVKARARARARVLAKEKVKIR